MKFSPVAGPSPSSTPNGGIEPVDRTALDKRSPGAIVVGGNLHRDLLRLGIVPCAVVAITLTAWFTRHRLNALEDWFNAEGQAVARQIAAMSDLSVYAGDLAALQNVAQAALRSGQISRIEITNGAGIRISVSNSVSTSTKLRDFTEPITLREASRASAFSPAGTTTAGDVPIGQVKVWRDTAAYARERTQSLLTGVGIAFAALAVTWLWVRQLAMGVARPLRRVSRTVTQLGMGRFDVRCDVVATPGRGRYPPHEVARLARDIDQLAERLQRHQQISDDKVRDATAFALQRMRDAEQAALSRARFLAAASHDLRQPLHAMGLFIDGLLPTATDSQRPAVQYLLEGTQFMGVLLDDLLEISRLDAQVITPALSNVALEPLFQRLDAQHRPQADEAGIRLVWAARGRAVHTDPAMLMRVLGNLVSNALRHTLRGTVLIAARPALLDDGREGVRIEVRDNGRGISSAHQTCIFEEFYQVPTTEHDRRRGFGLGLSICARIAALLDSRVRVCSELGAGSTFSLTLPAAQTSTDQTVERSPLPSVAPLTGLRCLVVDDDTAVREATSSLLSGWGCIVASAASTSEALAWLDGPDSELDVLLCDLQLDSRHDGLTVITAVRQKQPGALAVLVSGATGPNALRRLRRDSVPLLTKPVAPAKLRALLSTCRGSHNRTIL